MPEYEVEFYWKEEMVYWEGDRGFVFDGAWGREPISTVVPDPTSWEHLPEWLRDRRELVLQRLRDCPGHAVVEDQYSLSDLQSGRREIARGRRPAQFHIADMGTASQYGVESASDEQRSISPPVEAPPPSL